MTNAYNIINLPKRVCTGTLVFLISIYLNLSLTSITLTMLILTALTPTDLTPSTPTPTTDPDKYNKENLVRFIVKKKRKKLITKT